MKISTLSFALVIIFITCLLGFLMSVGIKRNEAAIEKSKQFCAERGYTNYAECQAMWAQRGKYEK